MIQCVFNIGGEVCEREDRTICSTRCNYSASSDTSMVRGTLSYFKRDETYNGQAVRSRCVFTLSR